MGIILRYAKALHKDCVSIEVPLIAAWQSN